MNYLAKRTIHTDLWGVLYVLLCGPKGPTFLERPGGSLDVIVRPKATQVRRLLYSRVKELHHLNGRTPKCDIHKSIKLYLWIRGRRIAILAMVVVILSSIAARVAINYYHESLVYQLFVKPSKENTGADFMQPKGLCVA